MPGGVPLSGLVDLFLATSQNVLTGETVLLNEAAPRNQFLYRMLRTYDMTQLLQGGDEITDQVIFDVVESGVDYQPLESMTASLNTSLLTEIKIPWRFTAFNVVFDKHIKGLNNAMDLKRGPRAFVFKRVIEAMQSNLAIDMNRKFERQMFATPNAAQMEATGGKVPLSLFCTIHTFGAVSTDAKPTATVPPGFTTVQNVNPTTQPRWRNPVEFYSDGQTEIDAVGGPARWDGFQAFSRLYQRLRFKDLAIRPEYGDPTEPEGFISCSLLGYTLYEHATARSNDFLRHGKSNPAYPGLNYDGVPVEWLESMDHAQVWPGTAGAAFAGEFDESTDENGVDLTPNPDFEGPRYLFNVPKFYKKQMHKDHWLEETKIPPSAEQPFTWIVFIDNWHNNWCRSRQRAGGVVAPLADVDVGIFGT